MRAVPPPHSWGAFPDGPWVLHATRVIGGLNRWVDLQVQSVHRFDSRLLAIRAEGGERDPRWLLAADRADTYAAYRGMFSSGGLSAVWLATLLAPRRPRVIHGHYGPIASQLRPLARALRAPLVASFYGYDATMTEYVASRRWRSRYRRLFDTAAAFLAEGPAMGERLVALGCPREKLRVVRLPADEPALATVEAEKAEGFVVVAAARLVEKKGFDTAIRAFARAFRGEREVRLLVVGGGELETELRQLAASEGVAAQVTWTGSVPFGRYASAIASGSVAVYPSRQARNGDSEGGAPVTLIEAQWLGVPSVVSDHDDLPFVAAPEGSVVVPPQDVDAWADALRRLRAEPERLRAMGEAAARFVREHHSLAANVAAREAVYAEVSP